MDVDGISWDYFISFASPDLAKAELLADALNELGLRVFLSSRELGPGAVWSSELPRAVEGSRGVAVLLSEHTDKAHFQREEILLAIDLFRQDRLCLVPVFLEGPPATKQDWEFGLRSLQRLDYRALGLAETAAQLAAQLEGPRAEPVPKTTPTPDPPRGLQTYGEVFHGAALRIDRTKQWDPIRQTCDRGESALFLLHGPRQQNLDLFVSRLWHYLAAECRDHHRPYVVPLRLEFAKPRTAATWENHLRAGLAGEGGRAGTAEDLLSEAARQHPIFLVLSRLPIGHGELDPFELEALEEFLGDRLPGLIGRAATGRHPIRALLATHYEREDDSLVERLDTRAYQGCRAHPVVYRKLPAIRPLEWHDIEEFLELQDPRPPRVVIDKVKTAFEALDLGAMQFREVVELLGRELY